MIPFKLTVASRRANASPSVALEKGAYRLRPYTAKPATRIGHAGPTHRNTGRMSTYTALLLVLLALASISSFASAYYLFTTRWERAPNYAFPNHADDRIQVNSFKLNEHNRPDMNYTVDADEKFLSYLPHSGFHNQRMALENALVLARMLNRTLLVPSIRLGKPIRYLKFDRLHLFNTLSTKHGLYHCSRVPSHITLPVECFDYFDFTFIPWDWLVPVAEWSQRALPRWNLSDSWIHEALAIPSSQILTIRESERYEFQFSDSSDSTLPLNPRFRKTVDVASLAVSSERLIQLGTLFGTSRLRLTNPANILFRRHIRRNMKFANPLLQQVANRITHALGGVYLGAHIRIGDGHFVADVQHNMRLIWWNLLRNALGYNEQDTRHLEHDLLGEQHIDSPPKLSVANTADVHHPSSTLPPEPLSLPCRGQRHVLANRTLLNLPLFVATDARNAPDHPAMARFLQTFPCTFFLSDFPEHMVKLDNLVNELDGIRLKNFMLPFLDAMIVAGAEQVAVTQGSTFSRFVEDVLWRSYHDKEIVERGS